MMKFIERIKYWVYLSPLYDLLGKRSYAQSGEDLIAWGELGGGRGWIPDQVRDDKENESAGGFYVDIGAYHPKLFSNTYLFYKKGWSGICVDPNPQMEELYRISRPRDVFLNVGVGDVDGDQQGVSSQEYLTRRLLRERGRMQKERQGVVMEYLMFEDGAANTFSPEQAKKNQEVGRRLIGKKMVPILPLTKIFAKYLPKGQEIDLFSVDVEGMDLEVLRSNDWKKYRPKMVICEDLEFDFRNWRRSEVAGYLDSLGYELKAKTPYSLIFKRKTVE